MLFIRSSEKMDLLRKVPLFNSLSKRQLMEIGKHVDQLQVKTGQRLAKQGEKGWEFIFIVEGKASVKKDGKVIRRLSKGNFFGEISLIDGQPRTASVTAETDMIVLVVYRKSFDHLLNTVPGLQKNILIALCDYLRRAEKAINKV